MKKEKALNHTYRIKMDRWFDKRNQERIKCLQTQDTVGYANLCDELGIEPEDSFLYERSLVDQKY